MTEGLTDKQRFRGEDGKRGFGMLTERGLDWSLEASSKPPRAAAWVRGRKAERIEVRHPNCFTAALRMFDAVRESDLGVTPTGRVAGHQLTLDGVA